MLECKPIYYLTKVEKELQSSKSLPSIQNFDINFFSDIIKLRDYTIETKTFPIIYPA